MNKYTRLSDFEINKKVAQRLFLKFSSCSSVILVDGEAFDPCNNPADAMPIIIDNGISLITEGDGVYEAIGGLEIYSENSFLCDFSATSERIYRVGMEIFLMKKDAKNES